MSQLGTSLWTSYKPTSSTKSKSSCNASKAENFHQAIEDEVTESRDPPVNSVGGLEKAGEEEEIGKLIQCIPVKYTVNRGYKPAGVQAFVQVFSVLKKAEGFSRFLCIRQVFTGFFVFGPHPVYTKFVPKCYHTSYFLIIQYRESNYQIFGILFRTYISSYLSTEYSVIDSILDETDFNQNNHDSMIQTLPTSQLPNIDNIVSEEMLNYHPYHRVIYPYNPYVNVGIHGTNHDHDDANKNPMQPNIGHNFHQKLYYQQNLQAEAIQQQQPQILQQQMQQKGQIPGPSRLNQFQRRSLPLPTVPQAQTSFPQPKTRIKTGQSSHRLKLRNTKNSTSNPTNYLPHSPSSLSSVHNKPSIPCSDRKDLNIDDGSQIAQSPCFAHGIKNNSGRHKGPLKRAYNPGPSPEMDPTVFGPTPTKLLKTTNYCSNIAKVPSAGAPSIAPAKIDNLKSSKHKRHKQSKTKNIEGRYRTHKCPYPSCDKIYFRIEEVNRHVNCIHERLKNYVCDVCFKSFGRKDNLIQHMKTHFKKDKQHKCDECGKFYTSKITLNLHKKKIHGREKNVHSCH